MSSAPKAELTPEHIILILPRMTDYIETTFNEQPAREYPDGSIRNEQGHWLTRHPGSASVIDSERSQELHARKAAKRQAQRDDFEAEVQRALVSQVAKEGALPLRKTAGGEIAGWIGNLGAEMRQKSAPKEHGIRNYQAVTREVAITAGLIEEKKADDRQITAIQVNIAPGVAARYLSRDTEGAGE